MNERAPTGWLFSNWEGRNYALPTHGLVNTFPIPGVWRTDWLRAVGMEAIPETLDEMEEALWRFRHQDPDGDGEQNTWGLCPNAQTWFSAFSDIFGAYGVLPYDWIEREGRVVWGGVTPEARAALTRLRDWYEREIIHPDFVSSQQGGNDTKQKFVNGQTGYYYGAGYYKNFDLSIKVSLQHVISKLNPGAEVETGWFPIGPEGRRGGRVWGPAGNIIVFGKHLEETPAKVVRVLKMFEAFATNERLFMEGRTGKRGVHWEYTPEEGLHLLPPFDERGADKRNLLNQQLNRSTGFFTACGTTTEVHDRYTRPEELAFRDKYRKRKWALMNVIGRAGVVPSANEYLDDLRKFQLTAYAEMIRGDRPLSYFDEFVAEWRARGGDILTREANEVYAERRDIYARVGLILDDPGAPRPAEPE